MIASVIVVINNFPGFLWVFWYSRSFQQRKYFGQQLISFTKKIATTKEGKLKTNCYVMFVN